MPKALFTVTLTNLDGSILSDHVEGDDEIDAIKRALEGAGLTGTPGISARADACRDIENTVEQAGVAGLPAWGWMVTATTPDGRIVEQQFLVALEDGDTAITAAKSRADPAYTLALGPRVEGQHLARRKLKLGDVYELGNQRIGRGKNARR